MTASPTFDDLRRTHSLFLAAIREPSNNDLRIVVVEGRPAQAPVQTEVGLAFPVSPDPTCRAFELTWWCYVAYSVRNESYYKYEEGAQSVGGPFGVSTNSAYLAYVSATTFATDDYPGPLTHWYLHTEWHCIDVVSVDPPELRELRLEDVEWDLGDRNPTVFER